MDQRYIDRMLQSKDRRLNRLGEKLSYGRRDMVAAPAPTAPARDEMADLRAEYEKTFGKRPFMGWPAEKLLEMIKGAG